MNSNHYWQTDLYDNKLNYVSELGKGVVELLNPSKNERILDLGCGTGDLTDEIAKKGAIVTGMDLSASMIKTARSKYPQISFQIANAEQFMFDQSFDAVFSNAALHWMAKPDQVVECIWNVLNKGGRFVAEFGGKGNVDNVIKAISEVLLEEYSVDAKLLNPWYFPSVGEYCSLLERQGFRVTYAVHFDRPTIMKDGEFGLNHWLSGSADDFFRGISAVEKYAVIKKIEAKAKQDLFRDGSWYVDYKRLRIMAIKP